jgi:hypothetical protein
MCTAPHVCWYCYLMHAAPFAWMACYRKCKYLKAQVSNLSFPNRPIILKGKFYVYMGKFTSLMYSDSHHGWGLFPSGFPKILVIFLLDIGFLQGHIPQFGLLKLLRSYRSFKKVTVNLITDRTAQHAQTALDHRPHSSACTDCTWSQTAQLSMHRLHGPCHCRWPPLLLCLH